MRVYAGEVDEPWMDRAAVLLRIYKDFPGVDFVEVRRGHQIWMVPRGELREQDRRRVRVHPLHRRGPLRALVRRAYLAGFLATLALEALLLLVAPERLSVLGPTSAAVAIFNAVASVFFMAFKGGGAGRA